MSQSPDTNQCKCGFRAPELGPHPDCPTHGTNSVRLISNGGRGIALTLDTDGELFIEITDGRKTLDAGIDVQEIRDAIWELQKRAVRIENP